MSVGTAEQLAQFLELNPELAGAKALIDDSADFAAYRTAGFTDKLGDVPLTQPPDFKPPKALGPLKWLTYLRNVMALAPIPKDKSSLKFGDVPEGVKVLGGTFAIDDDSIVFSHKDPVPGATPSIERVLQSVGA